MCSVYDTFVELFLQFIKSVLLQANIEVDPVLGGRRSNSCPFRGDTVRVLDGVGITAVNRGSEGDVCSEGDCEQKYRGDDLHVDVSSRN